MSGTFEIVESIARHEIRPILNATPLSQVPVLSLSSLH